MKPFYPVPLNYKLTLHIEKNTLWYFHHPQFTSQS